MSAVKKIIIFPIILMLELLGIVISLLLKAECWVAGTGFLILAAFTVVALIKKMWLQAGIFVTLIVIGTLMLGFSANIAVWIETFKDNFKHI